MKRFLVTVFCMINPTNQFGIYDDSGDIKIVDENAKKLQFFSSKIEDNCLGSTACSRKNFQSFIPDRKFARKMWDEYVICMGKPTGSTITLQQHFQLCLLQRTCKNQMKNCIKR